jgi:prepilin-type N-terminal cleavage/methylation domain-containing protein
MRKMFPGQNGFTVLEVIVAIALLLMMSAAVVTVFGSSYSNIFSAGNKNEAMAFASEKMEALYARQPINAAGIQTYLESVNGKFISTGNDITIYDADKAFNFSLETVQPITGVSGQKVTIVRFYRNGSAHVSLSSFLRSD